MATLAEVVPQSAWREPFPSAESGFRNKAKLVVGGRAGAVTLGILDRANRGVDLRECGLYEPAITDALPPLDGFVDALRLVPYDVASRQGELKHIIVTGSPDEQLMVRFVLRSRNQLRRLRAALPDLTTALPGLAVASVNLQPEHKAVLEGDVEIPLTERQHLPMRAGDVTLGLRPNSFFQTNTAVATGLYRQAAAWIGQEPPPASVWDLYCGVGGFALHARLAGAADVLGVEVAPDAVASARASAAELGISARFEVGDAAVARRQPPPEMVVVNPPRRGIGTDLADWLETSEIRRAVYSSCNPASLARDLARMPSWHVTEARLFDMFPQTSHQEVMVQLRRT